MAITINTNIPAQQAQISLERAQNGLDTAMQRLATGYRINSAADDAAGLQISNRMTAQINGLTVAVRNANDGISIAQTAEGAMSETTSLLQQMRDLAVQSASDSNSAADREALNDEVVQLVAEINRIASTTSFGGQNLLDGSFTTKNIQVGAYANEVIPITVTSTAGSELGILGTELAFKNFSLGEPAEAPGGIDAQNLTVSVNDAKTVVPIEQGASASEIVNAVSSAVPEIMGLSNTSVTLSFTNVPADEGDIFSVGINGVEAMYTVPASGSIGDVMNGLAAALVAKNIDAVGGSAANNSTLTLTDPSGANMLISVSSGNQSVGSISSSSSDSSTSGKPISGNPPSNEQANNPSSLIIKATVNDYAGNPTEISQDLTEGKEYEVTGAIQWISTVPAENITFTSNGTMLGSAGDPETPSEGNVVNLSVDTLDISTYTGAQQAIGIIDHALADIDANRATLGAIQNRFQHTIYNLQNVRENMMASRSRIEDTDYASEMSTLTREQVLKQASMASLNRANQMQQDVLTLIN